MKVLMVTPSYHPIIGGTETLVRRLAIKINEMGIYTDVMTFNMDEKWKPAWRKDIEKEKFRIFKIPAFNPFGALRINPLEWLLGVNVIPKPDFIKKFKHYDIIHFFDEVDLSFPLFSYFLRRPKIMQCLTLQALESFRNSFFQRNIFRRFADLYIASSLAYFKLISDLGVPKSKIITLLIGVDTETFRPDRTKKLDDLILFVGRLVRNKGLHILLQALSYLKIQTELIIIGPSDLNNPEYAEEIMHMCHAINEKGVHRVKYLGALDSSDLIPWYQKATIFVCPNLSGGSGGTTSLEALACGIPVIGTGNHVIKNRVNGILVSPNDPKKLANAIRILLENKELRERYGKEGRSMVERYFSLGYMANKLIEIYDKLSTNHNAEIEVPRARSSQKR